MGNLRSKHNSVSNGISRNLYTKIQSHEKVILITTVQIYDDNEREYYPFTKNRFE